MVKDRERRPEPEPPIPKPHPPDPPYPEPIPPLPNPDPPVPLPPPDRKSDVEKRIFTHSNFASLRDGWLARDATPHMIAL
jgi:hypothetical protein